MSSIPRARAPRFLVAGLESLPSGDLYEMWLIDAGGTPLAVGTIDQSNPDLVVATLEQDLAGFAIFAVTVEPERVRPRPAHPVMVGTSPTERQAGC